MHKAHRISQRNKNGETPGMENDHKLATKELILEFHWMTAEEKTRHETREFFLSPLPIHHSKRF